MSEEVKVALTSYLEWGELCFWNDLVMTGQTVIPLADALEYGLGVWQ